ncbi:MAG: twin-arginine translocase TatA/TatE family subunit [Bacteroidetes bacterium]|nr:twin-arginine translocase TatA/TatE family subunit [Bacteroidota bacterium]
MKLLSVILFLDSLGGGELLVVIFFALLFFGSDKLPGLMRGMGNAMHF